MNLYKSCLNHSTLPENKNSKSCWHTDIKDRFKLWLIYQNLPSLLYFPCVRSKVSGCEELVLTGRSTLSLLLQAREKLCSSIFDRPVSVIVEARNIQTRTGTQINVSTTDLHSYVYIH